VLEALAPRRDAIYVDGTFGAGGYAAAMLDAAACRVFGIDRDPDAVARATALAARYDGRLTVIAGRFGEMDRLLAARGIDAVDGVALDLGVSSMQIDTPERGFSFRADGPLDMRMGGIEGASAADVVNDLPEAELADVIFNLGEERRARQVARAIVAARHDQPIRRTGELADIVRRAVAAGRSRPRSAGGGEGIDLATRTFQALRIYVNDELGELERGLQAAERLLAPDGRLVVVAFHSLEDRIVKSFLRERCGARAGGSRHRPAATAGAARTPTFEMIHRGVRRPSRVECEANPRARSARLRAARRTGARAWPAGGHAP
jgi:16S rRNA (cytosine1402-N4)-methyltransferase